ncbi:retrovirus-related pol polyprotein from transposon TNT 1-94 [Tanacetum coccineum]
MFDEYFNPPTIVVSPVPVADAPRAIDLADSPVSTSIDQNAPSTNSLPQGSSYNVRPIHTPFESLGRWTKDHPIANIDGMQEEIYECERLEVWELVPCPDKVMLIKLKWIYKVKTDEFGGVLKNKARLVAQGFRQEEDGKKGRGGRRRKEKGRERGKRDGDEMGKKKIEGKNERKRERRGKKKGKQKYRKDRKGGKFQAKPTEKHLNADHAGTGVGHRCSNLEKRSILGDKLVSDVFHEQRSTADIEYIGWIYCIIFVLCSNPMDVFTANRLWLSIQ